MSTAVDITPDLPQSIRPFAPVVTPAANRNNNFNILRLILATLVIFSHSPELTDGNRNRELLTRIFGTLSFGEVAVNGFFLLSGFLIVQSWQRKPNFPDYLKKRVLRIYPGFIVASLVSAFIVGPLGSNAAQYFSEFRFAAFLWDTALLRMPSTPPVFDGQPHALVNGAMWTIQYEFRCYLLVALFGTWGLIGRRSQWLALSGVVLLLSLVPELTSKLVFAGSDFLFANQLELIRFLAFFCSGGCFYLFRDRIRYKTGWLIAAALVLCLFMFKEKTAQLGLATCGAYLLFWFAHAPIKCLERFRNAPDISYGVYLYGWPIQKLLVWYIPSISPWLLFVLSCGFSAICGLLSWNLVERPFLNLVRKRESKEAVITGESAAVVVNG